MNLRQIGLIIHFQVVQRFYLIHSMYVFYIFPNLYIYYICNHHVVKSDYWNGYILGVNGALPLGDTLEAFGVSKGVVPIK